MSEDMNDPLDNEMPEDPKNEPMEESLPIEEIDTGFEDSDITDDDKLWTLLAYVLSPLLPVIIMLMDEKKDRPFIKAHNAQALAWGIVSLVVGGATSFLCFPPICPLGSRHLLGMEVISGRICYNTSYNRFC